MKISNRFDAQGPRDATDLSEVWKGRDIPAWVGPMGLRESIWLFVRSTQSEMDQKLILRMFSKGRDTFRQPRWPSEIWQACCGQIKKISSHQQYF
eukprot:scaffold85045_cov17-Prasinocladus_malaysianus.AAC.1